jgi:hypothetical protein
MRTALRRPVLWAAVLYALLSVAFVSPALLPDRTLSASDFLYSVPPWSESRPADVVELGSNFELVDQALQFEPFLRYTDRTLPDVPLWNPHVMGGRPFLANSQSAVFSPFSAPAYATGVSRGYAWALALKLFVAALGAYLLARALRLRFAPSLLAGVVYAFGLYFVAWLVWPLASVWAWLPLLLALTEVVVRRPGPLPAAGLAVVTALQFFGGHPESSFHVVFAALAFFALRLVVRRREARQAGEPRSWRAPVAAFAGSLAGGGLLAAIALVPLAEMILNSAELEERTAANPDKISPRFLAMAFLPDYWGQLTQVSIYPFVNLRAFYAGALPLMLAVAAPILRPSLERIGVAALGLGALAVVVAVPPVHQVVNALPGFSTIHNGRLAIFYLLAVALLSAYALDDLVAPDVVRRRQRVMRVSVALMCLPLVWLAVGRPGPGDVLPALETAWAFAHPERVGDVVKLASLIVWLSFAGAAVLLLSARTRGRMGPKVFGAVAVALVVADLFRIGIGIHPAIEEEHAGSSLPTTGAIEYLQSRRPARFVGASAEGTFPPLEPNLAMDFGLYDARGYDFPTEHRYSRLWKRAVHADEPFVISHMQAPVNERSLRAFSLLSVADILASREAEPLRAPGLRLAYDGPDARVYANERALPRASLVSGARMAYGEDAALDAVLDPGFDGRRFAVIEKPIGGLGRGGRPGAAGTARIVEYERERVVIEARAAQRSLLVLTDVHFPGWKATVNGHEVPVQRVNYLMRGIPLYPGPARIEFSYEPASWRIGWILSLAALVLLAAVLAVSTASRLRGGRARARSGAASARARP